MALLLQQLQPFRYGMYRLYGRRRIHRQKLNVFRMRLLGAKVESVTSGSKVLKDAVNEAMKYWVTNLEDTHYIIGSALGAHPYPEW